MHWATAPPLELEDELDDDELEEELLLDEELELDEEELEELELLDELLDELDEELEPVAFIGTEHSFTPPPMRPPKVASLHMNCAFRDLYRNMPARPKATLLSADTEQALPSLQIVM